jgi:3-oxoadipate enol-lactonase
LEKAQVNGTTIAYEIIGQGEPLLFIHGAGVSHIEFQPQYETLGNHFRLILPDVRGHGESGQTHEPYSIKLFSDDLSGLLDVLNLERVFVVGHSMGGGIAQQLAVDNPERVRALILAETNYGVGDNPAMRLLLRINGAIIRLMGIRTMVNISVRQMGSTAEIRDVLRQAYAPQMANPDNFWNIYRALSAFNGREQLSHIQCPTLVMIAENNRMFQGFGHTIAQVITDAQLITIPNAGHGLNWDNPEAFNSAVIEFLDKVTHGHGAIANDNQQGVD